MAQGLWMLFLGAVLGAAVGCLFAPSAHRVEELIRVLFFGQGQLFHLKGDKIDAMFVRGRRIYAQVNGRLLVTSTHRTHAEARSTLEGLWEDSSTKEGPGDDGAGSDIKVESQ